MTVMESCTCCRLAMGNTAKAGTASECAVCNCDDGDLGEEEGESVNKYGAWSSPQTLPSPTDEEFHGTDFEEGAPGCPKQSRQGAQVRTAQEAAKNFVRALVRGHEVDLLSLQGGSVRCTAFLDRQLTTLALQRGTGEDATQRHRREIELRDVEEVVVGEDGGSEFGLETDGLSVTLVLRSRRGLAFAFDNESERDTFALCMAMFVDEDRRKEASAVEMVFAPARSKGAGLRVWEQEDVEEVVVVEREEEDLEEVELNPNQLYHPPWEDTETSILDTSVDESRDGDGL